MSDETGTAYSQIETPRKPKRKYARKAKPAAKASTQPKVSTEFAGMTASECCAACTSKHCVITAQGICGHPMKGGLQAPMMIRSDVVARYNRARKQLAHVKLDALP